MAQRKRVFISDVSTVSGQTLCSRLADSFDVAGSTSGPLQDSRFSAVASADAIHSALKCDVIILNFISTAGEAATIVEVLRTFAGQVRPSIVALSFVGTWAGAGAGGAGGSGLCVQSEWRKRQPAHECKAVKSLEDSLLSLREQHGLPCTVLATGVVYGAGEGAWRAVALQAWAGQAVQVPQGDAANNTVLTIHAQDLCSMIHRLALHPSPPPYIVASDRGQDTISDICRAWSRALGSGAVKEVVPGVGAGKRGPKLGSDPSMCVTWAMAATLPSLTVVQEPSPTDEGKAWELGEGEWHAQHGPVAHMQALAAEFLASLPCARPRVLVYGPPGSGRTLAATALAARLGVPVVSAPSALELFRTGQTAALQDGTQERADALAALQQGVRQADAGNAAVAAQAQAEAARQATEAAKAAEEAAGKGKPGGKEPKLVKASSTSSGRPSSASAPAPVAPSALDTPGQYKRPPRLPASLVAKCMRAVLTAPECRNKGWVLDGWPRTQHEAAALFASPSSSSSSSCSWLLPTPEECVGGAGDREEKERDAAASQEGGTPAPAPLSLDAAAQSLCPTLLVQLHAPQDSLLQAAAAGALAAGAAAVQGAEGGGAQGRASEAELTRRLARHALHESGLAGQSLPAALRSSLLIPAVDVSLPSALDRAREGAWSWCVASPHHDDEVAAYTGGAGLQRLHPHVRDAVAATQAACKLVAGGGVVPPPLDAAAGGAALFSLPPGSHARHLARVALGLLTPVMHYLAAESQGGLMPADMLLTAGNEERLRQTAAADRAACLAEACAGLPPSAAPTGSAAAWAAAEGGVLAQRSSSPSPPSDGGSRGAHAGAHAGVQAGAEAGQGGDYSIEEQEAVVLEQRTAVLRQALAAAVLPILSEGLLDAAKVQLGLYGPVPVGQGGAAGPAGPGEGEGPVAILTQHVLHAAAVHARGQ